jgi:hypothetical protein
MRPENEAARLTAENFRLPGDALDYYRWSKTVEQTARIAQCRAAFPLPHYEGGKSQSERGEVS